nr:phosphatidylinositol-binding clathrin assembly protein [Desmodus rotundus]
MATTYRGTSDLESHRTLLQICIKLHKKSHLVKTTRRASRFFSHLRRPIGHQGCRPLLSRQVRKGRGQALEPSPSWLAVHRGDARMGSSVAKAALAATTDELTEPEPKHLADLIQYINETNKSVEHLADVLSEKTRSSSWVVVFKALVTVHHLMVHGNERFIKHLASRDSLFTLHNFLDNSVTEGPTMSTFIRQYSRYLNEKSLACRLISSDITKTKRGMDGMMRTMNTRELLTTLQVIQIQFDALLTFKANPEELTNGIIHAAFMLLFKDSLCLFAAYNEGILNLLGKFFDMRKSQCEASLDIYIKFLDRTTRLAQFLKVAEEVGIDQNNIPYITQAPLGLLEALKQHLASLEEKSDDFPPSNLQHSLIPSISDSSLGKASSSQALFSDCKFGESSSKFGESLVSKFDMKSPQSSKMEVTEGMNWSLSPISIEPFVYKVPLPVACPVTSQHVPMYGMTWQPCILKTAGSCS